MSREGSRPSQIFADVDSDYARSAGLPLPVDHDELYRPLREVLDA